MSVIKRILAREVFDSRGNPTVEVEVYTERGRFSAMVPSGASTGSHEAVELRDNEKRLNGKGVLKAVRNVNEEIASKITGMDVSEQREIDNAMIELDGTPNKGRLGANAILGVSMAVCRAGAEDNNLSLHGYIGHLFGNRNAATLPIPQLNVINGGKHAGYENDIQEYLLLPVEAKDFRSGFESAVEVYHDLKKRLKKQFGPQAIHLGDEGGFVPPIPNPEERLELLSSVVEELSAPIKLGIDAASSEFFHDGSYKIGSRSMTAGELVDYYSELVSTYPLVSIEDGMAEDDWESWKELMAKLGNKIQLVGDDMLVTNPERIERAVREKAANSLLLKVNQIGTVTEALKAAKIAMSADWSVVVSHRSGETEDAFIADLAVGIGATEIKTGAPARSERLAKYNQLLRISERLQNPGYAEWRWQ
ncbi:phosphopyruvate hydratase [Candidatus Woesearchaeota archaeon]|nr:MAG: phosphopyruvate hydratase [Candidatus Woesearchaeota archaeon]